MYLCLNKEKKNLWILCIYCIYTCMSNGQGVSFYFTGFLANYVICDHVPNLLFHCLLVFLLPHCKYLILGFKWLFMIEKQKTLQLMPCERNLWEQKAIGIGISLVWAYCNQGTIDARELCVFLKNKTSCGNRLEMWASDVYSDQVLSKWKWILKAFKDENASL